MVHQSIAFPSSTPSPLPKRRAMRPPSHTPKRKPADSGIHSRMEVTSSSHFSSSQDSRPSQTVVQKSERFSQSQTHHSSILKRSATHSPTWVPASVVGPVLKGFHLLMVSFSFSQEVSRHSSMSLASSSKPVVISSQAWSKSSKPRSCATQSPIFSRKSRALATGSHSEIFVQISSICSSSQAFTRVHTSVANVFQLVVRLSHDQLPSSPNPSSPGIARVTVLKMVPGVVFGSQARKLSASWVI